MNNEEITIKNNGYKTRIERIVREWDDKVIIGNPWGDACIDSEDLQELIDLLTKELGK